MPEYRLFTLKHGMIDRCEVFRARDDQAALLCGRAIEKSGAIEIWREKQRIAVVPPSYRAGMMPAA